MVLSTEGDKMLALQSDEKKTEATASAVLTPILSVSSWFSALRAAPAPSAPTPAKPRAPRQGIQAHCQLFAQETGGSACLL